MSVSPGRTESKASVSKKRNIEKSLEKLTAVIFAAEWDQAARIIYHLKPCDIIVKYCIFLLARTQFLETLENVNFF